VPAFVIWLVIPAKAGIRPLLFVIRDRAGFSYLSPGRCLLSGESPHD